MRTRSAIVGVALVVVLVGACGGATAVTSPAASAPSDDPATTAPTPNATPSTPAATATPTATASATPGVATLEALDVIDIPGVSGAHGVTWDAAHQAMWATGDGAVWRIDPATMEAASIPVAVPDGSWTGLTVHDGDLWASDFYAQHLLRVDPATGSVRATIDTPHPTALAPVGSGLWFAHELEHEISRIDLATNEIGRTMPGDWVVSDGTTIWYSRDAEAGGREAVHADGVTGKAIATYPIPAGTGCGWVVDGSRSVWTWCPARFQTTVATIDLQTGAISSFVADREYLGGLVLVGDRVWAAAEADGPEPAALFQLDRDGPSGTAIAFSENVHPDTVVVVGDSLWVPSEPSGEVFRFPIEPLRDLP